MKSLLKERARLRLRVTAAAESKLRAGHPWLFTRNIREQNREGELGELAVVYDRRDQFLAVGLFDPHSPIGVRLLSVGQQVAVDDQWWSARLEQAVAPRRGLFDERTTGFRWINGESDGWPGLVLDRYDKTLVLKLYTPLWLPRLQLVVQLIRQRLAPERLVLRLSRNLQLLAHRGFDKMDGEILSGPPLEHPVTFLETGLRFEADVLRGQKTGFFLDQRENRRAVQAWASGRTVLNAFSFSGAFSLYAARGGARAVTDLDSSSHALAAARRNFQLNDADPGVARCWYEQIQAEAFDWLGRNFQHKFELIIVDPPSLAKREAERAGAIRAYRTLASLAIRHLVPNGILLACSCSAHVKADEFFAVVRQSATTARRRISELRTSRHPPDHPATFPEAEYLKAICLQLA